jgi:hypothetical protein
MQHKSVIFVVISILVIAIIYSPSATFGVPNYSNHPNAVCSPTGGKSGPLGLEENKCCWKLNTGQVYCSTCENGGTRGMINCSDPEIQHSVRGEDITGFPEGGVVDEPPTPIPAPTSPFAPPTGGVFDPPKAAPTTILTPFPTPPQDDGSGPLNPQGGGILQQPEEVEDPEDEGENEEEEDSSEGAETAGPLT